jgi:Bardet-Biedl syndrome 5 protein
MTTKVNNDYIWQDRDVRFDSKAPQLELRKGEVAIETLEDVEDTKGNCGDRGVLVSTNLRLMWISAKKKRTNLSIGLSTVVNVRLATKSTTLTGPVDSVVVMTKYQTSNFEFIFSAAAVGGPGVNVFARLQALHRSYDSTRLYRDLKLRGAIIKNKELDLLRHEQVVFQSMRLGGRLGNC